MLLFLFTRVIVQNFSVWNIDILLRFLILFFIISKISLGFPLAVRSISSSWVSISNSKSLIAHQTKKKGMSFKICFKNFKCFSNFDKFEKTGNIIKNIFT